MADYFSKDKKIEEGRISLSLLEQGVPPAIAFSFRVFFGRGRPHVVNPEKAIRSQLKAKLNSGLFEYVAVGQIGGTDDVLKYFDMPEDCRGQVDEVMKAGKGYSHATQVGGRDYLVRTDGHGHKVLRVKDISNISL